MPDAQPPVYDPNSDWQLPGPNGVPAAGTYGSAGAGGPGFKYDRATLEELAKDWNDLANEFRKDQDRARIIAATRGPGLEYASEGNADKIRNSGRALAETLIDREKYCRSMADKFNAALGKYTAAEDSHSADIKHSGGSL